MKTITITDRIRLPYISSAVDGFVRQQLTILNPVWQNNVIMKRKWANKGISKYIIFFEPHDGQLLLPRGFLEQLEAFLIDNDVEYCINDLTVEKPEVIFQFERLLWPFQTTSINELKNHFEGVLCAPTGSGKTTMGIKMIAETRQPTIVLVHTTELLNQWTKNIYSLLGIKAGKISGGKIHNHHSPVTVALVQTLINHPEVINQYGFLICDECHRCPSETFTSIIQRFNGKYILGLSATPFRQDGLTDVINFFCGPTRVSIEIETLIAQGYLVPIIAIIRKTEFLSRLKAPGSQFSKLMSEISKDQTRNKTIINDIINAANDGETCLVLSDRKEHCLYLHAALAGISGINCEVLTSDVSTDDRKKIINDLEVGKINVCVATSQLIGEGFDCPKLSAIFFTMPIKFSGRILQYIGRVLRRFPGKTEAKVYDYFDHQIKSMYSGYKERQKIYQRLQKKK